MQFLDQALDGVVVAVEGLEVEGRQRNGWEGLGFTRIETPSITTGWTSGAPSPAAGKVTQLVATRSSPCAEGPVLAR